MFRNKTREQLNQAAEVSKEKLNEAATASKKAAHTAKLNAEIQLLQRNIKQAKADFGCEVFDIWDSGASDKVLTFPCSLPFFV